jgi:glycine/D-amino acid oxidase-like deaminating enzyme
MTKTDVAIIGGGINGGSTGLELAKNGLNVTIIDKSFICRGASGVNAGTLTMHMTRAQLIPYAKKGWELWMNTSDWLSKDIDVEKKNGLCLAFTEDEEKLLIERSEVRKKYGADIKIISRKESQTIDPNINPNIRCAAFCEMDGYVSANQTGQAYSKALRENKVKILENYIVSEIDYHKDKYVIIFENGEKLIASKVILATGVHLEKTLKLLKVDINIKCLPQQLIVSERMPQIMDTVITVANGKLSLKQFKNGTVLIGGGWPGVGNIEDNYTETKPENLIGNMMLACHAIPRLKSSRVARVWLGLEAETDDAMPIIGKIPVLKNAYVIGSIHSGYTSGPYMGKLLAQKILGKDVDLSLFDIKRFL